MRHNYIVVVQRECVNSCRLSLPPTPDVQDSRSITVKDYIDGTVAWTIKLPDDFVRTEVTGAASTYQGKSIKVKRVEVRPADLMLLQGER